MIDHSQGGYEKEKKYIESSKLMIFEIPEKKVKFKGKKEYL
jgi:hypothetical protein